MKCAVVAAVVPGMVVAAACSKALMVGVVLPDTGTASVYGASIKPHLLSALERTYRALPQTGSLYDTPTVADLTRPVDHSHEVHAAGNTDTILGRAEDGLLRDFPRAE